MAAWFIKTCSVCIHTYYILCECQSRYKTVNAHDYKVKKKTKKNVCHTLKMTKQRTNK